MGMGVFQQKTSKKCQIGAAISGPRITGGKLRLEAFSELLLSIFTCLDHRFPVCPLRHPFGVPPRSGKEKAHKHEQIWGIAPGTGWEANICIFVFLAVIMGGIINKIAKNNPRTIP